MKPALPLLLSGLLMILLFPAPSARAQDSAVGEEILSVLRVVRDTEGTANLRSGPSTSSKVLEPLKTGFPVVLENAGEEKAPDTGWQKVAAETAAGTGGYLHGSRLERLNDWTQQAAAVSGGAASARVKAGDFTAEASGAPFVASDHRISKDGNGQELVDGESPWGRDGGLPAQSLVLKVSLGGKSLTLPKEACRNLYEPDPSSLVVLTPKKEDGRRLVLMTNSDGAGAYCVAWVFHNGVYLGRAVFVPF